MLNVNMVDSSNGRRIMAGTPNKKGNNSTKENVILVGSKPTMSYVMAVVTEFNDSGDDVVVKARGRMISKAVDAVEVVKNRFLYDAEVTDIKINTERITNDDGRTSNVSSIEIYLTRNNK